MKKYFRLICLSISLVLMLYCFTACAQSTQTDTNTSTNLKSTETTPAAQKAKSVDKVVWVWSDVGYSSKLETTQTKEVHQYYVDKFGIDLQPVFVAGEAYASRLSMMLSSGEQLDFFREDSGLSKAVKDYQDGLIIDLTNLINSNGNNILSLAQNLPTLQSALDGVKLNGKMPILPEVNSGVRGNCVMLRQDWLKKFGMTINTISDLETYLEAVKTQDPDGNGKTDTYGLMPYASPEMIFAPYFLPAGSAWWLDGNGQLQSPVTHPNYEKMLATLASWYKKGYLPPDVYNAKSDQKTDWVINNQIGGVCGWYSSVLFPLSTLQEKLPDAYYMPIVPKGEADAANKLQNANPGAYGWSITSRCKCPEKIMQYWDDQHTKAGQIMSIFGVEGSNYKRNSEGMISYISDKPDDWNSAKYANIYNQFPLTSLGAWDTATKLDALYRAVGINTLDKMNDQGFYGPDVFVPYDTTTFESSSKLNDLTTFLSENVTKILVGEIKADQWNSIVEQWRKVGGDLETKDRNNQYKKWKESSGK